MGLPLPSKLKDLDRTGDLPLKGKYGLVSISDANDEERLLVGPNFYAQARLSDKEFYPDSDSDNYQPDDVDDSDERSGEREDFNKNGDGERQVEPTDNYENPFGLALGKYPLFPPAYEGYHNFLINPYLPPYNLNIPFPILNQYLQRRAYNAPAPRYPNYGQGLGQGLYNTNSPSISPFSRYFYVQ